MNTDFVLQLLTALVVFAAASTLFIIVVRRLANTPTSIERYDELNCEAEPILKPARVHVNHIVSANPYREPAMPAQAYQPQTLQQKVAGHIERGELSGASITQALVLLTIAEALQTIAAAVIRERNS